MKQGSKYLLLYLPLLISLILSGNSILAYFIAWTGSFYIFYLSFTNKVKHTSINTPFSEKILKPLFLMQIIFAGYMSCTSIFYFMDLLGYEYTKKIVGKIASPNELSLAAICQQYYLLGHAALVHGLLFFYKDTPPGKYQMSVKNWPAFFIRMVVITSLLAFVCRNIGGLSVLAHSLEGLSFISATLAFAISIPLKKVSLTFISGIFYALAVFQALTSGFKEPVIVSVLILGIFLYPFYRRLIIFIFLPLILFLFAVLPTYVNSFRVQIRGEETLDKDVAKKEAMQKVREDMAGENMSKTNWFFLTDRISEIGMFTKYKESMDERKQYYKFQIVFQSLVSLVPRIFWSSKPITEEMAMVRVIENGIVEDYAIVSAKPQYIVDGYLSGGVVGIWLALFFYGMLAQIINNKAELFFGGYFFGTAFVFTGIFRDLWRGNCFEFIFNDIFWGYIVMICLFFLLKRIGVLTSKVSEAQPEVINAVIQA